MIFPKLTHESMVQVDDKLRLDASLSFVTEGEEITDIEIKPSADDSFISVMNSDNEKWFLDWAYEDEGEKIVTVKITTGSGDKEKNYPINCISAANDALFSNDSDLFPLEPDLRRLMPQGKNSFIYAHRKAQEKIFDYLDEQRIWKQDGSRFTKADLMDKEEFRRWSTYQTLLIIFESMQVSVNDIFEEKRQGYQRDMNDARNRASLRLDTNGDGVIDSVPYNIRSTTMVRR